MTNKYISTIDEFNLCIFSNSSVKIDQEGTQAGRQGAREIRAKQPISRTIPKKK
jgi:hypothetical protein